MIEKQVQDSETGRCIFGPVAAVVGVFFFGVAFVYYDAVLVYNVTYQENVTVYEQLTTTPGGESDIGGSLAQGSHLRGEQLVNRISLALAH
jgi:hypothetical protein